MRYEPIKRLLDITLSAAGMAATAPLFAGIAVLVKLDSPGAVFFRQKRVGRRFEPFRIWKFRTMAADAEKRGPLVTAATDRRVTRVGRLLRSTKLDELPQLINVMLGEMSLVGPRPEVPKYVSQFQRDYEVILAVRPGITDEASIRFRNEEDVLARASDSAAYYLEHVLPQKIELYKSYVENMSPLVDLSILVRTLWIVVAK